MIRARARRRHTPGTMNKLEVQYSTYLDLQKIDGSVLSYRFEPIKLRLAEKTFYNPDFWVITGSGLIEIHEVKCHWEDDARVKIKVAAEMYPELLFVGVTFDKRTGWQLEYFNK